MTVQVRITDRSGREETFGADPGRSLLHTGLASGCGLPYECASGTCGSCKAMLVSGDISELWSDAPGKRSCRAGEVLLCQTAAVSAHAPAFRIRGNFTAPLMTPCREFEGSFRRVRRLTEDTAAFVVTLDAPITYQPGQFALVTFPYLDGARAYSMTGAPRSDGQLSFLIRRLPGGGASNLLFSDPEFASNVRVFGPLGKAVLDSAEDRPFVAIAGGSGIAGLLSIVESAAIAGLLKRKQCRLFFGLRNLESAYLLDELSEYVKYAGGAFSVTIAFSDSIVAATASDAYPLLTFGSGLVHDVARSILGDARAPSDAVYFVAGPPLMVEATMRMLVMEMKVRPTEIRYDRFG